MFHLTLMASNYFTKTPIRVLGIITQLLLWCTTHSSVNAGFYDDPTYGFWPQIGCDYQIHYGLYGMPKVLLGIGVAGIMANDDFDHIVRDEWQTHLRGSTSDRVFNWVNDYGGLSQYQFVIPLYLATAWLGYQSNSPALHVVGKWGARSFRALLVGAPQQAVLTEMLGSPRPEQGSSHWSWFNHNRAVSGHAFYGSLPILTAAKLSDSLFSKFCFYTLSLLPPIARIHHDKHYASQAFLGWWLAFQSVNSVAESEKKRGKISSQLIVLPHQIYFQSAVQF